MRDDAPDQPGATVRGYRIERLGCARLSGPAPMSPGAGAPRPWAGAMGSAVRACFAMVLVIGSLPVPARGQPKVDASRVIPVHPSVTTTLQLPDDVELARFTGSTSGMMRATTLREFLYIQPRADLQAGTEVVLYVKTATLRRRFRLRVVGHAREAWANVVVLEPEPAPTASASTGVPAPAPPRAQGDSGPTAERDEAPAVLRPGRIEVSWHLVGSLGFTGIDVAGYQPSHGRQPHAGFGARLAITRRNAWWALEANLGGDWPGGPMSWRNGSATRENIDIDGPWLRAEVGGRWQLGGTKWNPSLYGALGAQAHLRRTEAPLDTSGISETMPHGAVGVLGIGLQRRAGTLLVGLDFQVRKGWPDGYHSMAVFWSVGSFLDPDQEQEP
jgi:hypothetical protein